MVPREAQRGDGEALRESHRDAVGEARCDHGIIFDDFCVDGM